MEFWVIVFLVSASAWTTVSTQSNHLGSTSVKTVKTTFSVNRTVSTQSNHLRTASVNRTFSIQSNHGFNVGNQWGDLQSFSSSIFVSVSDAVYKSTNRTYWEEGACVYEHGYRYEVVKLKVEPEVLEHGDQHTAASCVPTTTPSQPPYTPPPPPYTPSHTPSSYTPPQPQYTPSPTPPSYKPPQYNIYPASDQSGIPDPKTQDLAGISSYTQYKKTKRSLYGPKTQGSDYPIPTRLGHYTGCDVPHDRCDRDEAEINGVCYQLLSQGPCYLDEHVLLNICNKGYCAPRLCAPDRVFLFDTQSCHDPLQSGLCPPGRILYTTAYGTPICSCPDLFYENDIDMYGPACLPLLSETSSCPNGEVFWFKTFRLPALCRPDPCNGLNLYRPNDKLPYVPSDKDGKCYEIGSQPTICHTNEYYVVDMLRLKGVCLTLEDAGYIFYNEQDLYGPLIPKDTTPAVSKYPPIKSTTPQMVYRRKRAIPSNVVEKRLVNCASGARVTENNKCDHTAKPSRSRQKRSVASRPANTGGRGRRNFGNRGNGR